MEFNLSHDVLDPIINSIKFINLNYKMIKKTEIQCFLMKNLKRTQDNSYRLLYDSIMISSLSPNEDYIDCDLTLHYLQFNLILDLKNDIEFERFYDLCADKLINWNNLFDITKLKCKD